MITMIDPLPIAILTIKGAVKGLSFPERPEEIYGGYANGRGAIVLFTKEIAYAVNFKNQILRQRPPLNVGAQARYDATEAGADFEYGTKTFHRLSRHEIADICTGGEFRLSSRL